jgi:peptide methionine sulfoxide reductase MsrB
LHGLRELLTLFMALRARDYSVAKDKFESGTGWPSFTQPLDDEFVVTQRDFKLLS